MPAVNNTKDGTLVNGSPPEASLHHFLVTIAAGDCQHEPSPQGFFSVTVNGNWRIIFRFDGKDVELVDYLDYH